MVKELPAGGFFVGFSRKVGGVTKGLGEAPKSCTRKEHESATNSIAKRGQGGTSSLFVCPLQGQGTASLVGFGATPQPFRGRPLQRESQQGAGSEASLPVTSRVLRRAPKLLYRPTVQCRAKWARPHSLPAPISANKTQPEDSQHPPTYLTPLLHICHIPNSPRKHQQLPGRKSCEKKCERDRKPSSVEGRSSIQT